MKVVFCVALAAALALFSSLSDARGTPTSSFIPRASHQDRATLNHKHNPKPGRSAARRSRKLLTVPPPN